MKQSVSRSAWSVSWTLLALLLAAVTAGLLTVAWPAAHAQNVVTTIPVGDSPQGVAVNSLTNRIFIANNRSHDVSVIDGATNSVMATVSVDSSPSVVAVNPRTNRIYVANCNIPRWGACVIDGATNSVIASLGITVYRDMTVNPQANRIYAHTISGNDDRITVIDGATHEVLAQVPLGTSQYFEDVAVAVNSQTNRIYVTYSGNNALSVVDGDTNAIVTTISLAGEPDDVAVNPDTNRIYVIYGNNVAVIDGATHGIVDTVSELGAIDDLAVNPLTNRVYINGMSEVHVVDGTTNHLVTTVSDLPSIWDLAVNPQTGRVYVTHSSDDIVSVIQDVVGPPPPTATPTATSMATATATPIPTIIPTPGVPATPTPTVTWTPTSALYLPLLLRNYVVPEPPLPLEPPPLVGTVEAGGLAVIDVVNDTPDTLTLEFDGPGHNTTVLERCAVCRIYDFIGPIFCPTEGRPRTDIHLTPGTYQVRASVGAPDIRDYAGEWSLEGNTRYFLCFYIVRTRGSNELTVRPSARCPVE